MSKDRRPHVLHLVRWYPYPQDPMYGLFIRRHILATTGHARCTVIFVRPDARLEHLERVDTSEENLREITISYPERPGRIRNSLAFMRLVWSTAVEVYRSDPFDLVHVHVLTRLGVIAWALKRRYGVPYVITEHWSRYIDDRYHGALRKWWTKRVVAGAGALINVSEYLQNAMVRRGLRNRNMAVVPNVVDCDVFRIRPTEAYFVHVSCFQREAKNVFGLVEAMALAKSRGMDFRLLMVGVGVARDECMALAESLGVADRVEFPGLLEGEELGDCIGRARAMVVYSDYENLPVVILEALCAGVPVISTRVGGTAEVVGEENGILIAPRDADALIAAMKSISDGERTYDREAIRSAACAKFGTAAVSDRHRVIYSKILAGKGGQ